MDGFDAKVAGLTRATTNLLTTVNVSKASLDADEATASTKATDAATNASDALGYRNTAETYKNNATTYSNTATSTVSYSEIAAIAESKAVTAVDVFVYDTSKDSDGGEWRYRCQHTSWYNETLNTATRGSRREFPAVAVIVAESNKVTIYDGDDPTLPMWMVFNASSGTTSNALRQMSELTAVTALNGILSIGSVGATAIESCRVINFIKEVVDINWTYGLIIGSIEQRNDTALGFYGTSTQIVNRNVRDIAMTVLPNAPIDQATGLPVPTIAVATNGGVSVIKDDGTVSNSSITFAFLGVDFSYDGLLYGRNQYNQINIFPNYKNNSFGQIYLTSTTIPAILPSTNHVVGPETAFAGASGISKFHRVSPFSESLISYITSTYNTGWMVGDIQGAFLSDTDTTSLVGSELVTNGTFDTDTSGWSGDSISVSSGVLQVDSSGGTSKDAQQLVSVEAGKVYEISADTLSTYSYLYVYDGSGTTNLFDDFPIRVSSQDRSRYIVPTGNTILVRAYSLQPNISTFDNISVKLADADRSVNKKGLVVNGTITRTPVATGADLVAYTDFRSANYLEQAYNSDLDFGTGDFCVMGWVNLLSTGYGGLVHFSSDKTSTANNGFCVFYTPTALYGYVSGNSLAAVGTRPITGSWEHICFLRRSGVLYLYQNSVLTASIANTRSASPTDTTANLLVAGYYQSGSVVASSTDKFCLIRISATAPSAEQIAKIYEDEKVLFTEGAQATLYGTSSAVTALAYDEDTELLHVGTSAGRSVFQGLARVDNTTTAVGTAISAVDGLVVEE